MVPLKSRKPIRPCFALNETRITQLVTGGAGVNDSRDLTKSRRRLLTIGLGFVCLSFTGCGDPEVGTAPPVAKKRTEVFGDGPLNDPVKEKSPKKKR